MPVSPSGEPAAPLRLIASFSEIADHYALILCDVWGVIHNGERHHRGAVEALIRFRKQGGRVVLITNAPNPQAIVRKRLAQLAVPQDAYDAIVTSGDVTVSLLRARGNVRVLHIGPPRELAVYREVEAQGGAPRLTDADNADVAVCVGLVDAFHEEPSDYDAQLAVLLRRGLDLICANPDLVVQVGPRLMYCAGSIADRYERIGGTVIQAGKPHALIYDRALDLGEKCLGHRLDRRRVLAIGDAMRTDISGAERQGLDSLFVLSGIHQDDYFNGPDGALDAASFAQFIARAGLTPTAAIADLVW